MDHNCGKLRPPGHPLCHHANKCDNRSEKPQPSVGQKTVMDNTAQYLLEQLQTSVTWTIRLLLFFIEERRKMWHHSTQFYVSVT